MYALVIQAVIFLTAAIAAWKEGIWSPDTVDILGGQMHLIEVPGRLLAVTTKSAGDRH